MSIEASVTLNCAGKLLDLSSPRVMGILNVTPDSFSDGGKFFSPANAVAQALSMQEEGAAIVDVGGESTRPGAQAISVDEELRRVIPVIEAAAKVLTIPISIDTTKPEVMKAAISAGAGFINDVMALRAPGALRAAAECGVPVCLMHMQGKPNTMQNSPEYADVPDEVKSFLLGRLRQCLDAGIPRDFIMLDPGIGFGKKLQHNLQLLRNLDSLLALGQPIMVGASRKSMIGALLGDRPVADRVSGSVAAALFAATRGAKLIRAHDVGATADALRIWQSLGTSAYKD